MPRTPGRRRSSCSRIFGDARARLEEVTGARTIGRCAARDLRTGSVSESSCVTEMTSDSTCIVIGAGHAGVEAAWAAARMGRSVAICTLSQGHDRAHAVQSGDWRHREGASRPGDRRAGRADGPGDRCHGDPVQAAQSQSRPGGLVAARPGRQAPLQRVGARRSARSAASTGSSAKPERIVIDAGRVTGLELEERRLVRLRRTGGHDRDVSQRPGPCRARTAAVRPRRRAAVARARRIAEELRLPVGPAEDRHAAPAGSARASTSRRFERAARRRAAGAVLVHLGPIIRAADRMLPAAHDAAVHELVRANIDSLPSTTARFRGSGRATARRSKTR